MILHTAMKHLSLLLLGTVFDHNGGVAHAGSVLQCPPDGTETIITVAAGGGSSLSLNIKPTTITGKLCTLTLRDSTGIPVPIARSYDAQNWEVSGGPHMSTISPPTCTDEGSQSSYYCTITNLPIPPKDTTTSSIRTENVPTRTVQDTWLCGSLNRPPLVRLLIL